MIELAWGKLALGRCGIAFLAVVTLAACGGDKQRNAPSHSDAGRRHVDDSDAGGFSSAPKLDGGPFGGPRSMHTLAVSPSSPLISVDGKPQSVQFTAELDGVRTMGVNWSVDDVLVGVIDATGAFRAFGDRAGVVTVTAQVGALTATAQLTVNAALVENPIGLPDEEIALLRQGGNADPLFGWLYPYDGTVFPEGLGAPLMQFDGAAASAMRIAVSFPGFKYEGFLAAEGPTPQELAAGASTDPTKWALRVSLPDKAWDAIAKSTKGKDDIEVNVTKLRDGKDVSGPVTQHWRIAEGELQGMVYYNTYNSATPDVGGAIMRVPLGGSFAPVMGQEGSDPTQKCTVCHSVSANGKVLTAAIGYSEEPEGKNSGNPIESASFDLSSSGAASLRKLEGADGRKFAFGGLTPDGAWMLTNGVPDVPLDAARVRGLSGYDPDKGDDFVIKPQLSALIETATGMAVDLPSFSDQVQLALTPQFAPDGSALAFSWYDDSPGHTLATASFRGDQSPPEVGRVSAVLRSDDEVLGWPSFTPDAKALVFHAGDGYDTNRHGGGAAYAQVRLLDLDGNVVSALNALNGLDGKGKPYLPYGDPGREQDVDGKPLAQGAAHMNYEPNVLPVAIGGYYWVFFTSRRTYGNVIDPDGVLPLSDKPFGSAATSPRKKIWVAAVDIDYHGKLDPSHPAFYLPGQELGSGNMRAFTALAPCRGNSESCSSGVQCCSGFCRATDPSAESPTLECVPPPSNSCANENEACMTTADCCDVVANHCINKRCAQLTPE